MDKYYKGMVLFEDCIREDKTFTVWNPDLNRYEEQLCHHTGKVRFNGKDFEGEFEDSFDELHYGN